MRISEAELAKIDKANAKVARLLANNKRYLNWYQLACGYVQTKYDKDRKVEVRMWRECGYYHVRATREDVAGWIEWIAAIDKIEDARKEFKRMVVEYIKKGKK